VPETVTPHKKVFFAFPDLRATPIFSIKEKKMFLLVSALLRAGGGASLPARARRNEYKEMSRHIAEELDKIDCDILAIHDPQLLWAGHLAHLTKHKIYFSSREIFLFFEPKDKNVLEFTFLSCIGLV